MSDPAGFTLHTDLGTFAAVQAKGHADLLARLRTLVAAIAPSAREKASAREGSVWWGTGPRKKADGVIWAMPHRAHLNVGVFDARGLPDPAGLLEGTGAKLRHVKVRDAAAMDGPALRALLAAAWERAR